jgi:hypothetical protein
LASRVSPASRRAAAGSGGAAVRWDGGTAKARRAPSIEQLSDCPPIRDTVGEVGQLSNPIESTWRPQSPASRWAAGGGGGGGAAGRQRRAAHLQCRTVVRLPTNQGYRRRSRTTVESNRIDLPTAVICEPVGGGRRRDGKGAPRTSNAEQLSDCPPIRDTVC